MVVNTNSGTSPHMAAYYGYWEQQIFAALDGIAKPGAILASNTSYLDVPTIAAATRRPRDVLGMHFFSPANVMKLLEVVRPQGVAEDAVVTAMALG